MSRTYSDTITVIPMTGLKRNLAYRVPEIMLDSVHPGSLVRIPLLNRTELAIVKAKPAEEDDFPYARLKFILSVNFPFPVLTEELMKLAEWMRFYYATSSDAVFETMIPAAVRKGMGQKLKTYLSLALKLEQHEFEKLKRRAPKQAILYEFLARQIKPQSRTLILKRLELSASSCQALLGKGIVQETRTPEARHAYADEFGEGEISVHSNFELTKEQEAAVDSFGVSIEAEEFKVHLLHGVTGSGKTEVYFQAVRQVINKGRGVLFLVPEVALTPQTVGRIRGRLEHEVGAKTVVWHSHLSEGERFDTWHALATGEAQVVVGARSAVFAPVGNLGLIVVDEEHEPAFKQDEVPRYHGRDVAVYRAFLNNAVCILGSATPSLESLYNVSVKKYQINRLTKRIDDRKLPMVHVVDMRQEIISQRSSVSISRLLVDKMRDRLEKREQTILFINRRGYSTSMLCPECGFVALCSHCSVTLTYHRADGFLRCHLCGHEEKAPHRCPQCGSTKINWRGMGTQKVEDIVGKLVPKAKVVRIDADSMRKKDLFRKILSQFRLGRIDILVGTQMIAKGLDFPNVTLVGLIDADISLHIPDFRAGERTFQLIVQVAGRAGRGDVSGEVIVQSFLPFSEPIQFARRANFEDFQELELEQRKEFHYPPYRHLVHHIFRGKNPEKVSFYAEQWTRYIEKEMGPKIEIRGPAPCPIEKIKDNYRFQVWYFVNNVTRTIGLLKNLRDTFKMDKDVIDVIDVDPVHLI